MNSLHYPIALDPAWLGKPIRPAHCYCAVCGCTEFRTVSIDLARNEFWCPLPAWPALNNTASCRHCPDDVYLDDVHRTCSDHGVCIDGQYCRCDPKWTGATCNALRCPSACNGHGTCINALEPEPCVLGTAGGSESPAVAGLCQNLADECVAAYHDCPQNGISVQVDSTSIVIAEEAQHNNVVLARCICTDSYFGNDCSMPPLPPPTEEPWPDPYASGATRRGGCLPSMLSIFTTICLVACTMRQLRA